jgi:hypothetical protein
VLDCVIGNVAWGDFLSRRLGIVQHFGGDGRAVLNQFFRIFRTHAADIVGNRAAQAGHDFFLQ